MGKITLAMFLGIGCSIGFANMNTAVADELVRPIIPETAVVVEMPYKNRLCGEEALLAMGRDFFAVQCGDYLLVQRQQGGSCSAELWYDSPNDNYTDVMRDTNCDGIAEEFLVTDANGENMHHANPDIVRYESLVRTADMDQPKAKELWLEWLRRQE